MFHCFSPFFTAISIHALREEGDLHNLLFCFAALYFYPRPPRGGRQFVRHVCIVALQFLSTPSARRATGKMLCMGRRKQISIHALREEGDLIR